MTIVLSIVFTIVLSIVFTPIEVLGDEKNHNNQIIYIYIKEASTYSMKPPAPFAFSFHYPSPYNAFVLPTVRSSLECVCPIRFKFISTYIVYFFYISVLMFFDLFCISSTIFFNQNSFTFILTLCELLSTPSVYLVLVLNKKLRNTCLHIFLNRYVLIHFDRVSCSYCL